MEEKKELELKDFFPRKPPRRIISRTRFPYSYPRRTIYRRPFFSSPVGMKLKKWQTKSFLLITTGIFSVGFVFLLILLFAFFRALNTSPILPLAEIVGSILLSLFLFVLAWIIIHLGIQEWRNHQITKTTSKGKKPLRHEGNSLLCHSCYHLNNLTAKFCENCSSSLSDEPRTQEDKIRSSSRKTPEVMMLTHIARKIQCEKVRCHHCGVKIETGENSCPKCGNKRIICPICKQYLNYDDDIAYCFFCETNFHFSHLMEWIKMKTTCPTCKKRLLLSEVVRRYTYEE